MVEYGFDRLNLHRIDLGVFAEHKAAVRCYEKAGFKVEGRMREDLFQDGEYKDRLWMGLLDHAKALSFRPGNWPGPSYPPAVPAGPVRDRSSPKLASIKARLTLNSLLRSPVVA